MDKPLAIDLYCGLGGWTEGLLAEGFDVVGFDIERHQYGDAKYPAQLVLQDVLTLHGSQFKDAVLIVASPPCQNYSYLAMPWSRSTNPNNSLKAKALRKKWETEGPDNRLFDACFRIQREACEAAGRFIPLVVENVRSAVPWVGPSRYNFGSFHIWGDVPALMPVGGKRKGLKVQATRGVVVPAGTGKTSWFFGNTKHEHRADPRDVRRNENGDWVTLDGAVVASGMKQPGNCSELLWRDRPVPRFNDGESDLKSSGVKGFTPDGQPFGKNVLGRMHGSRSKARKATSAQIAKIPLPLSRHIARCYYPC